jgi:hypothetical protein
MDAVQSSYYDQQIESQEKASFLNVNVQGDVVVNRRALAGPFFDDYQGADGGYIVVYTHNAEKSIRSLGGGIYVMGYIRVKGAFQGRLFVPDGFQFGDDITQDPALLAICDKYFPDMHGQMWVGGWIAVP